MDEDANFIFGLIVCEKIVTFFNEYLLVSDNNEWK